MSASLRHPDTGHQLGHLLEFILFVWRPTPAPSRLESYQPLLYQFIEHVELWKGPANPQRAPSNTMFVVLLNDVVGLHRKCSGPLNKLTIVTRPVGNLRYDDLVRPDVSDVSRQ